MNYLAVTEMDNIVKCTQLIKGASVPQQWVISGYIIRVIYYLSNRYISVMDWKQGQRLIAIGSTKIKNKENNNERQAIWCGIQKSVR